MYIPGNGLIFLGKFLGEEMNFCFLKNETLPIKNGKQGHVQKQLGCFRTQDMNEWGVVNGANS